MDRYKLPKTFIHNEPLTVKCNILWKYENDLNTVLLFIFLDINIKSIRFYRKILKINVVTKNTRRLHIYTITIRTP